MEPQPLPGTDRENLEALRVLRGPLSLQKGPSFFLFVDGPCEGDCVFCSRKNDPESPIEELFSRLDRNIEGRTLCIVGSDPLLHTKIVEIVRESRKKGAAEIEIMTSGARLGDMPWTKLLLAAGATSFSIPLHAAGAQVHDSITRSPGSFEAAIRGILYARKAGAQVYLHTTLIRQNAGEIGTLRDFIQRKLKAPFAVFPARPKSSGIPFPQLAVRMSEARRLAAFDLYGFPLCVSDNTGTASESMKAYFNCQQLEKPPKCSGCALADKCPGLFRDYSDHFGTEDLIPFAGSTGSRTAS